VLRKDFGLGDVALTCWQYEAPYDKYSRRWPLGPGPLWEVVCNTAVDVRKQNLHASFYGQRDDLPAFYKIIEGVTPVK
jgi:hypothetical protein